MKKPFFTVILPIYNVAPWLGAALQSVINQTFSAWECLAIEDGSTDTSADLLIEAVRADSRIKGVFQPNSGVSRARNRALSMAQGEYVAFLDSDDVFYSWGLEVFHTAIEHTQADVVRSKFPAYAPYCLERQPAKAASMVMQTPYEVLQWGWETFCRDGYTWTMAIKRECIGVCQFPEDVVLKEDVLFDLLLLPSLTKIVQLDEITHWYRRRMSSAVRKRYKAQLTVQRIAKYEAIWKAQQALLNREGVDVRSALSRLFWRELAACVVDGAATALPEQVKRLRASGALQLCVLPKRWQWFLRLCECNCVWPMALNVWRSHFTWWLLMLSNTLWRAVIDRFICPHCYTYGEDRALLRQKNDACASMHVNMVEYAHEHGAMNALRMK